jgi:hypothetical protein
MNLELFMDEPLHIHLHPSYLWAQQMATQRMVLALARVLGAEPEWRRQSTAQIQQLHDLMLNTPSPEAALLGLEEALAWVSKGEAPP